jgi:Spy/CpxP family protein refolding chaperone
MARLPSSVFLLCLFCLFLAPSLSAQESYREFERGLNLTDAQRAQAWAIQRKYIAEWRALTDESMRRRLELRMLDPDRPDQREQAERLQRDLIRIEITRQRLFHRYHREVSSVFTEEQRERFYRFMNQENRRAMHPMGPFDPSPRRRIYGR